MLLTSELSMQNLQWLDEEMAENLAVGGEIMMSEWSDRIWSNNNNNCSRRATYVGNGVKQMTRTELKEIKCLWFPF